MSYKYNPNTRNIQTSGYVRNRCEDVVNKLYQIGYGHPELIDDLGDAIHLIQLLRQISASYNDLLINEKRTLYTNEII